MGVTAWLLVLSVVHYDNYAPLTRTYLSSNVTSYYTQSSCEQASKALNGMMSEPCTQGKKACTVVQSVCVEKQV